jgi:hypothetical protein
MNQSSFTLSALQEAVQGFLGGSFAWLFTSALAGAIACGAATEGLSEIDWVWGLAWIGHLAVAGAAIWGLIPLCIHAGCLAALIHGTDRVLRPILIAFFTQLTTSAIVTAMFEPQAARRLIIAWLLCATPAVLYLTARLRKRKAN